MTSSKGRVRVETNQESPRTYNVGKGKEITIRTKKERPEVTGGDGGSGENGDLFFGCLIIIVLLVIAIVIVVFVIFKIISGVEYAINEINPNYVTISERAEERNKEDAIREASKPENIKKRITKEMEEKLFLPDGYLFYAYDCFILDNHVWGCGNLVYNKDKLDEESHPVVVYSEDGGKNYKILAKFEEQVSHSWSSEIVFLNEKEGFLSTGFGTFHLYKTVDGGKSWEIIVSHGWGMGDKIVVKNRKHISVEIFNPGCIDFIESYDGGESWVRIINGEIVTRTIDKGLNWESKKLE